MDQNAQPLYLSGSIRSSGSSTSKLMDQNDPGYPHLGTPTSATPPLPMPWHHYVGFSGEREYFTPRRHGHEPDPALLGPAPPCRGQANHKCPGAISALAPSTLSLPSRRPTMGQTSTMSSDPKGDSKSASRSLSPSKMLRTTSVGVAIPTELMSSSSLVTCPAKRQPDARQPPPFAHPELPRQKDRAAFRRPKDSR